MRAPTGGRGRWAKRGGARAPFLAVTVTLLLALMAAGYFYLQAGRQAQEAAREKDRADAARDSAERTAAERQEALAARRAHGLAFTPDGKRLLTATSNWDVHSWLLEDLEAR
jgi:hypothetical protein